jgi:hypothetical protein
MDGQAQQERMREIKVNIDNEIYTLSLQLKERRQTFCLSLSGLCRQSRWNAARSLHVKHREPWKQNSEANIN